MTLENQVTSLELSKKLKELGVKQESYFEWYERRKWERDGETKKLVVYGEPTLQQRYGFSEDTDDFIYYSAFTVAELGEMLKKGRHFLIPVTVNNEWHGVDLKNHGVLVLGKMAELTEADARAKMLIYLLEHNLITV